MRKDDLEAIPIWVSFPNLKLQHYTEEGLSKFANYLGKPLYTDKQTSSQDRVAYAGVCVELRVEDDRPNQIPYINEFGEQDIQEVEYEWVAARCTRCRKFLSWVETLSPTETSCN